MQTLSGLELLHENCSLVYSQTWSKYYTFEQFAFCSEEPLISSIQKVTISYQILTDMRRDNAAGWRSDNAKGLFSIHTSQFTQAQLSCALYKNGAIKSWYSTCSQVGRSVERHVRVGFCGAFLRYYLQIGILQLKSSLLEISFVMIVWGRGGSTFPNC